MQLVNLTTNISSYFNNVVPTSDLISVMRFNVMSSRNISELFRKCSASIIDARRVISLNSSIAGRINTLANLRNVAIAGHPNEFRLPGGVLFCNNLVKYSIYGVSAAATLYLLYKSINVSCFLKKIYNNFSRKLKAQKKLNILVSESKNKCSSSGHEIMNLGIIKLNSNVASMESIALLRNLNFNELFFFFKFNPINYVNSSIVDSKIYFPDSCFSNSHFILQFSFESIESNVTKSQFTYVIVITSTKPENFKK